MKCSGQSSGFTLVEVLIGMSLASMVLLAVMGGYLFLGRSLLQKAYYQRLESSSRNTLVYLAQDVRVATGVTSFSSTGVTLTMSTGSVEYAYTAPNPPTTQVGTLVRTVRNSGGVTVGTPITLLNSVVSLNLNYFDLSGSPTVDTSTFVQSAANLPNARSIKSIEIQYSLVTGNVGSGTRVSFSISSGRLLLLNRPLLGT